MALSTWVTNGQRRRDSATDRNMGGSSPSNPIGVLGPIAFGRGLIIGNETDLALIPEPFRSKVNRWDRIVIDDAAIASPLPTLERARASWLKRTPVLIIAQVPLTQLLSPDYSQREHIDAEPREILTRQRAVDLFPLEALHFYVTSNTYDLRSAARDYSAGIGLGNKKLWPAATPFLSADRQFFPISWQQGDIALNGRPVWIDGGPHSSFTDEQVGGAQVIHRDALNFVLATRGTPVGTQSAPLFVPPDRPFRAPKPNRSFTDAQLAALSHLSGPARVLAPAGSGKTAVLTERLRYLTEDLGWAPEQVLAVAYNVRARDEMQQRTNNPRVHIATLNSLGYSICRGGNGFVRPHITVPTQVVTINDQIYRDVLIEAFGNGKKLSRDKCEKYVTALGLIRLAYKDPEVVSESEKLPNLNSKSFRAFEDAMLRRGLLDMDGQIYWALRVLLQDPRARSMARLRVATLVVDEAQDLRPAHRDLIDLLANLRNGLIVIGDPDQTIYGYSGARPEELLDIASRYPDVAEYWLDTNFRCPPDVVHGANLLLGHNEIREPVTINANPSRQQVAPSISLIATDPYAEVLSAASHIQEMVKYVNSADIAVLCRVRKMLLPMQVALYEMNIPCAGPLSSALLHRPQVRSTLALLRIAAQPNDVKKDDLTNANLGMRNAEYIDLRNLNGRLTVDGILQKYFRVSSLVEMLEFSKDLTDQFRQNVPTSLVLSCIRERLWEDDAQPASLYSKTIAAKESGEAAIDDLSLLQQLDALHPNASTFADWLTTLFSHANGRSSEDGVHLSTIHSTKGLEWKRVILLAMNDGMMPLANADDLEEERRIAYVGVTRCKDEVAIVYDSAAPSPYLSEMGLQVQDLQQPHPPLSLSDRPLVGL